MLAPNPLAAASWPIAGDVPDLLAIVTEQADTIAAQAVLISAYQSNLNAAQAPPSGPTASGIASVTTGATSSIQVNGVTGTIVNGSSVGGTGAPGAVTVLGQISGAAGSNGLYLFSVPLTFTSSTSLTFTPPAGASGWPIPQDAPTLESIAQIQTAVLRTQSALIQHYLDLLNTSQMPAPPTGP